MRLKSWNLGAGESFKDIAYKYFYPEFITAFILYFLPVFIDAYFIGHLKSSSLYTISGIVDNFLNLFVKIAEGFSLGIVIIGGYHNGKDDFAKVGRTFVEAFWAITFLAGSFCLGVCIVAPYILQWFNFTDQMILIGVPFLRLRTVSIFLMFVYFALVGFLRSIKNSYIPMRLFALGSCIFVCADYVLIFGKFGMPALGLQGSAIAYCIQYAVMVTGALWYVLYDANNRKYRIKLSGGIKNFSTVLQLLYISFPILADKAIMACAYIWLAKMIGTLGQYALATFAVVKLMERLAFVPATAFSQVMTFLASNDAGRGDWQAVRSHIVKVFTLAALGVFSLLCSMSWYPDAIISMIDRKAEFGPMAAQVFPALSFLVAFDLLQLILSGALRGISDVMTVMGTRLGVILIYFVPVSYMIAHMCFTNPVHHFIAIYGSFFIGNALMSLVYVMRLWYGDLSKFSKVDYGKHN